MNVLIAVAHPDDEVIGVGGTSLKHAENGDKVYVIIMCKSRSNDKMEMISASDILKTEKLFHLAYEDQKLDKVEFSNIVDNISDIINTYKIDMVYTHTDKDLNRDHLIVNEAVMVATRPIEDRTVKSVLTFETASSTEYSNNKFNPVYHNDISNTIASKLKAIGYYRSELRLFPHPRSLKNIEYTALVNGAKVGLQFVESFEIIRVIN